MSYVIGTARVGSMIRTQVAQRLRDWQEASVRHGLHCAVLQRLADAERLG
jgi:hypothetical protein